ncbi:hypothetical protein HMI54_013732 [Coelomomyces lativittatus]|nr:hypothetical protein HMI55_001919 [Coelomomyces lativittatus]KAJ1508646.1 hypothetical protein HMI56_007181 [Coelomomyces lativittatus]KAJ1514686.1 hypothetical protein HMI54_013732 [Coelomomyces lativittatus]
MESLEPPKKKKLLYPTDTTALLLPELIPSDSDDESYSPSELSLSDNESSFESDQDNLTEAPDELKMGPVKSSYLVDWLSTQMNQLDHRQEKLKQGQRTLAQLLILFSILLSIYCMIFGRIPWQLNRSLVLEDLRFVQTWFTFIVLNVASKIQAIFGRLHVPTL